MRNCQITFKEDDQMIIVDFTIDDNMEADYKIRFVPEIKDENTDIGLAGHLCQMFLEALHGGSESDNVESETTDGN
jgi:hypothetical protein